MDRLKSALAIAACGILLSACSSAKEAAAPPSTPEPVLQSQPRNETVVPIQERFQMLGTAENEVAVCSNTNVAPIFGGDRRPRRECVDFRYPLEKYR